MGQRREAFGPPVSFLEGPVPAGGGTVTNVEATVNTASCSASHTVQIRNNTTGSVIVSRSITVGNTFCHNTSSAAVSPGQYLEVRIDLVSGPSNRQFRVMFRY
jgi:hypothetical protein